MTKNRLIIFAKYPYPGYVKTRMAEEIGAREAADIYRAMAEAVISRTAPGKGGGKDQDVEYERILYIDPPTSVKEFREWIGGELDLRPQQGPDLGERMLAAIEEAVGEGVSKILIIGTDDPLISRERIIEAFEGLDSHDCVIGPSSDGGYYLIGLKKAVPELFKEIEWGTSEVLDRAISDVKRLGMSYLLLDEYRDIDVIIDLLALKRDMEKSPHMITSDLKWIRKVVDNLIVRI